MFETSWALDQDAKGGFPAPGRFCSLEHVCRSAGLQGCPFASCSPGFSTEDGDTSLNNNKAQSCIDYCSPDRSRWYPVTACPDGRAAHARSPVGELASSRIGLVYLADGGVRRRRAGSSGRAVAQPRHPVGACSGRDLAEPLQRGAGHAPVDSRLRFPFQFWRARRAGAGRRGALDDA